MIKRLTSKAAQSPDLQIRRQAAGQNTTTFSPNHNFHTEIQTAADLFLYQYSDLTHILQKQKSITFPVFASETGAELASKSGL